MNNLFDKLVSSLEEEISLANKERENDGLPPLDRLHLQILGQSALLFNSDISGLMTLVHTRDLDALIQGDWSLRTILKRAIKRIGLEYDDLSREVWVPPGSSFILLYENVVMKIEALEPFFVFLSKAVKAPEKNRQLVLQGIDFYGKKLVDEINRHGGDSGFFIDG
ncbi:MAG TPA: hypothetical protein PKA63_08590 [Oligoflexia bacterium]|nr:hypothetical protein [Oligoflexia bacterium]HMP48708.1 hypothetical protein [Oligoflexia bacterium]